MKKLIALALFAALAVVGCSSLPTAQQQFTQACTVVNADLKILGTSPAITPAQQSQIMNDILPKNEQICAVGAKLDVTSLKTFHDSLLPIAIDIVQSAPAIPNQPLVLLSLQLFGPLVQSQIDMLLNAATPPVAASQ